MMLIGLYGATVGELVAVSGTSGTVAVSGDSNASLIVAVAGCAIALIGVVLSYKWGKKGSELAQESNEIAKKAGTASRKNDQRLRALSVRLERLRAFEDRRQKLRDHRRGFRDCLAAIEGAGRDGESLDGDIVQRSRMLSRSFRSAMEHYGESWEVFQSLKDDLDCDTVDALEEGMREAAGLFAENFSPVAVRTVASAHGRVLDRLTEAAERGLVRLKGRIDDAVEGGSAGVEGTEES